MPESSRGKGGDHATAPSNEKSLSWTEPMARTTPYDQLDSGMRRNDG
jgi:hypothetical protein